MKNAGPPWVDPSYPSDHNLLQDPRLSGPLTGDAYGMTLAADSPAIDAGDGAPCPATDIRGVARPVDGDGDGDAGCDMGAYERQEPGRVAYLGLMLRGMSEQ